MEYCNNMFRSYQNLLVKQHAGKVIKAASFREDLTYEFMVPLYVRLIFLKIQ